MASAGLTVSMERFIADMRSVTLLVITLTCFLASPALAAQCGGDFGLFVETFKREAAAKGISDRTVASAFAGVTPDPQVIALDRRQVVFKQTFEQFGPPRIAQRLARAKFMVLRHGSMLGRIEQQFNVQGEVLIAIWGLETDFGAGIGKQPTVRALATLANDCRRTDMFQAELMDALRIVERGDLALSEMRGAWAGELGQTQFLPSSYVKFAVDFDGDGKRNLIHSVPDVLASTANYLKGYGWQHGGAWTEGAPNFDVLKHWNKAEVYQKTIALFATRLAGNP